jgi:predicted glycosyltransferase
MKILTDLGHPKNVHVLKNLIPLLEKKGHEIHVVYRQRENMEDLCRAFGIPGIDRGSGGAGMSGKFLYLLKTDLRLLRLAKKVKPDLLLSFASPYLANLALLTRIPMVVFDDTENNWLVQRIYSFCSDAIVVPSCFQKTLSRRQTRFDGYYELAYLAPRYFSPGPAPLAEMSMAQGEKYVLLRFVSWGAVHDLRHRGLDPDDMRELAATFSGLARVFISAEGGLPEDLEPLRLKTPTEAIHQIMAHAALVFSEGATMAAEAAVLGVPTIHCSDLRPGYIDDLNKRHGLLATFTRCEFQQTLATGMDMLEQGEGLRQALVRKRDEMLSESVDVVEVMARVIEEFQKK